jgi:hypothetical protein
MNDNGARNTGSTATAAACLALAAASFPSSPVAGAGAAAYTRIVLSFFPTPFSFIWSIPRGRTPRI